MFCSNCGYEIGNSRFCYKCGKESLQQPRDEIYTEKLHKEKQNHENYISIKNKLQYQNYQLDYDKKVKNDNNGKKTIKNIILIVVIISAFCITYTITYSISKKHKTSIPESQIIENLDDEMNNYNLDMMDVMLKKDEIVAEELNNIHKAIENGIKCFTLDELIALLPDDLIKKYSKYIDDDAEDVIRANNIDVFFDNSNDLNDFFMQTCGYIYPDIEWVFTYTDEFYFTNAFFDGFFESNNFLKMQNGFTDMAICFGNITAINPEGEKIITINLENELDSYDDISSYIEHFDWDNAANFMTVKYNGEWYPVSLIGAFEEK